MDIQAITTSLLIAVWLSISPATASGTGEYEVKAAFIYNFTKFIEWPDQASASSEQLLLCVLGEDPFGSALDSLQGREVHGQRIIVSRFDSIPAGKKCHVLYISASEESHLESLIKRYSSRPGLLLISDIEGFVDKGGSIELSMAEEQVRFEINLKSTRESNLQISSRLLRLADNLVEEE